MLLGFEDLQKYQSSWSIFRENCEKKIKGKCELSGKNWQKLKEWHLENYLNSIECPFGFLFKIKYGHPKVFNSISPMRRLYYIYKDKREEDFK